MFDCAKDILAHHDEKVTLPQAERDEMRERRNSNRDRLRKGLNKTNKPAPVEFCSQGSYAMKTMTRHPKKDYDIDDGVISPKKASSASAAPKCPLCRPDRWCATPLTTEGLKRRPKCARTASASIMKRVITSMSRSIASSRPGIFLALTRPTANLPAQPGAFRRPRRHGLV
jgi:hypothetical protein